MIIRPDNNVHGEVKKIKNRLIVATALSIIFALVIIFLLYNNLGPGKQDRNSQTSTSGQDSKATIFDQPAILNGDFEQGDLGWGNQYAIQTEENGNHYIINNYSWRVSQELDLLPHTTYEVSASTKKGTAAGPARITFTFHDVNGKKLFQSYDIKYLHQGTGWEEIPKQYITIPASAAVSKIYLLTSDPEGYHCFDNIVITRVGDVGDRKGLEANADKQELLVNGDFNLGLYGWTGYASLIKTENDNKFIRNGYNWDVFQPLEVVPEQNYVITAKTRAGDVPVPSRIKIIFYNDEGQRAPEFYNILHKPGGDGWEKITEVVQIPPGYHLARIYLLADDPGGEGICDFDDISFKAVSEEELNNIAVSTGDNTQIIRGSRDNHIKYVVQSGDTASSIARHFGVPVEDLIDQNSLRNPDRLEVGQILYIPQH